MFPQAEDLARYWANIRKGVDAITEVPESHWRVADYFDNDPKAPDRTYAIAAVFSRRSISPRSSSASPPIRSRRPTPPSCSASWSPRQALEDAGYLGRPPRSTATGSA